MNINLNTAQRRWLETIYNRAFTESSDSQFALRFAADIYQRSKLNPSFETPDKTLVGVAALPAGDDQPVDATNTEDSIAYLLDRQLTNFIDSSGNLDSLVEPEQLEEIQQVEREFDNELFGSSSTFTDIDNRDNRFKRAMRSGNEGELGSIIDELVTDRVNSRNRVIANA